MILIKNDWDTQIMMSHFYFGKVREAMGLWVSLFGVDQGLSELIFWKSGVGRIKRV